MARGWTLADSTVDPLELADELKTYAREMVGESSVQLTSDRERILLTAALEIELYCREGVLQRSRRQRAGVHVHCRGGRTGRRASDSTISPVGARARDGGRTMG